MFFRSKFASSDTCGIVCVRILTLANDMIKYLLSILLLSYSVVSGNAVQVDILDNLSNQLKAGNSKEIASSFTSSVELSVIDEEDVYAKAQAEQILRSFFSKHPPVKAAVIHRLDTNPNYRYGAFSLATKSGNFRVSVTMKKIAASFFITELRIEAEK